ncbi:hypothetical protein V6N12_047162 [Hibiscus sabdariffa]|uniref:Uncharacterized protein n=1 Tax=Hibiscus sabdariffa TaxID=183260 RepID=A0ABR2DA32_9ROSI
MVVELRHQCNMNSYRPWTSRNNSVAMVEGSKFAVLSGKAGIHEFLENHKNTSYIESNPGKKKKASPKPIEAINAVPLVSSQDLEVATHNNMHHSDQHTSISIVKQYDGSKRSVGGKIIKSRGHTGRGLKVSGRMRRWDVCRGTVEFEGDCHGWRQSFFQSKANVIAALLSLLQSSLSSCIQRRDGSGRRKVKGPCILQLAMVDVWWSLLGAAIPAVIAGQAFRMKKKHAEEQRMKSARGREKSSDDIFVCERVCTSKRMLKKVGAFSKDPIPDTCVTVCGVSELDACSDACARTVCVNQHQVPNWNDICLRRCQSECLRLSASNYS